ncbi:MULTISPECIES: phage head closure protein [unclassified Ruegeria]|uniref:phage head closure protein n=1 Tax=unclassified Ruegeria TaxID=2625375 RepID=UPI001487A9BF|nr:MULTISPECIES: phage head closure protein [unclassified Ruegeria]NOD34216.1 phage head closure protein [Ruegeria sp. HKCCD7296]NOE32507.1 phage head closure protein [Ruegeria sp. HKCCD7318]NOE41240.1 phage head closure protein [Ruegeria sp. HKCCD7319]
MNLPHLNRRLMLEAPIRSADGSGGYIQTWAALGTLWAEVTARSGTERQIAGVSVSRVGYRIVVRGAPEGSSMRPAPDQRFREGNRRFVIRAVAERDPRGQYLTCFADEEVAA